MITQERLKELLSYDPETGLFYARQKRPGPKRTFIGSKSGHYIRISIDDVSYRAHRLAWLWMTGEWPPDFMDHIDGEKQNNKWINLRLATKSQNQDNCGPPKDNKSGFKGVSRYRQGEIWGKPWQAGIQHRGKKHHLGHFATAEEAHEAYRVAALQMFGEFARVEP